MVTPGGSFRVNNGAAFIAGLSPEQRARFRGNCIRMGFTSLAVIPVRYQDQTLGKLVNEVGKIG